VCRFSRRQELARDQGRVFCREKSRRGKHRLCHRKVVLNGEDSTGYWGTIGGQDTIGDMLLFNYWGHATFLYDLRTQIDSLQPMPRTARASVGGMCYHVMNRATAARRSSMMTTITRPSLNAPGPGLPPPTDAGPGVVPDAQPLSPGPLASQRWRPRPLDAVAPHQSRAAAPQAAGHRGHIWQGRFKAFPIQEDSHLLTVLRYVERNPVRAGLVRRAGGLAVVERSRAAGPLRASGVPDGKPRASAAPLEPVGEHGVDREGTGGRAAVRSPRVAVRRRRLGNGGRAPAGPGVHSSPARPPTKRGGKVVCPHYSCSPLFCPHYIGWTGFS